MSKSAQLLSNKVAAAIRQLWSDPEIKMQMPENAMDNADFIDIVNQWFDLYNMAVPVMSKH